MLEKLQAVSPDAEIWWDAPPSAFAAWAERAVAAAAPDRRSDLARRLTRFFDPTNPERSLITGATSNPRLVFEALELEPVRWAAELQAVAPADADDAAAYWALYQAIFRESARLLSPRWTASRGRHGWVCAQTRPAVHEDAEALVAEGRELAAAAPNVMAKVPASRAGLVALERLSAEGVATNTTWCFSVAQALACAEAIARGRAKAPDGPWRAVVTFMAGRFGAEAELQHQAAAMGVALDPEAVRWAEVAILKRIHALFVERRLPVTLLVCSLKLDAHADGPSCAHLEESVGARCVYTVPPSLLADLADPAYDRALDPAAIARPVPADVLMALMRLPYFRAAYAPDGLEPEAFTAQSAYRRALAEAEAAYRHGLDWVRRHRRPHERTP